MGSVNQTRNPFGFRVSAGGGGEPNLKPFRVSNVGAYIKPENPGFRGKGLNQTRNPFEFRVSDGGVLNQTPNPFSEGGMKPETRVTLSSLKRGV